MPQNATAPAAAGQPSATAPQLAPAAPSSATSAEIYQALRAQRRVLGDQLEELEDSREQLVLQLRETPVSDGGRVGLEQRLAQTDQRISTVTQQIDASDALVAQAAAVPGATVRPPDPPPWQHGPPEELVALGIAFTALLIFPLVLAWSRRIWRRSAVSAAVPAELSDRLGAMERSLDSVAIEVERIGEGQRFVTRLLAERAGAAALPLAAGEASSHGGSGKRS